MNLKKKIREFFTLDRNADGFTLIELIVTVAIVAILGGVGVPAYSGYIEKTNKNADITLAADVAKALALRYYANPQENMVSSVTLTTEGASAGTDEFAIAAMNAAFGVGWENSVKLKYGEWGNGAAVSQEVVNYFVNGSYDPALGTIFDGSADISYTDNIPELFDLLEDTAISIAGKREKLGSGANMVTNAATTTMGLGAEDFSNLWASSAWDSDYLMDGVGSDYNGNAGQLTDDKLTNAIANAGVIKARNVALATYLKDLGYDSAYDSIANYTYQDSVVPDDAAGAFLGGDADKLGLTFSSAEEEEGVYNAICNYYNINPETFEAGDPSESQAYTDGLAYYAMMSTVDSLKDSGNLDKTDDGTWWNDLSSAVDMYSAVANGSASLDDLNNMYSGIGNVGDNTVVTMLVVKDGVPNVMVSPVTANP